jgi:GT2 family glycosyltransferase
MTIIRNLFIKAQRNYNFYVKKEYFIDNMQGSNAIIMVLTGKYPDLWSVSLRRIYEYGRGLDVVLVNAGGFHRELAINVARDYGFSYFESYPNNYVAAQNYFLARYARSNLVIKIDDDVFVTKNTFRNMLQAFQKLKDSGVDIGFVAPVLNVNTVSYYYFLKTLGLLEEYKRLFEEPVVFRESTKQIIWRDPAAAKYIWEKSLPLNQVAQVFRGKEQGINRSNTHKVLRGVYIV